MVHLWVRAESRRDESRVGLTPDGARDLIRRGFRVSVEDSPHRVIPTAEYRAAGALVVASGSWPEAPPDAIILGLDELPEDGSALPHRHIMFGHAFDAQPAGQALLRRFRAGGGRLYDLEYLLDEQGRRLAAFGYWAGYAGAAVSLKSWAAQQRGGICGPVGACADKDALAAGLRAELDATGQPRPRAIVIGARGRVGTGAADLCAEMGVRVTKWDVDETAHGGPFPEILLHGIFLNCILAQPGCPVFVPETAVNPGRALRVIGDIACDPASEFNPVRVYDRPTSWDAPARRVAENPALDVVAIDNLPLLLPRESSLDYAAQLLPALRELDTIDAGAWGRAAAIFDTHLKGLQP